MAQENPFAEALRQSVARINDSFAEADRALHDAVVEASDGIRTFTEGRYVLRLGARNDNPAGRSYALIVMPSTRPFGHTVDEFFVPQSGYPIFFGSKIGEEFQKSGELKNTADIRAYLLSLVSNLDSPLAVYLAYQLRPSTRERTKNVEE